MMNGLLRIFRQKRAAQPVFIVSGLPRSGTSLMMMMLESGGLQLVVDDLRGADLDNPKGYYEFERVKKLKDGDFEWLKQAPGKVVKVISALLPSLPSGYAYKVIFMRRSLAEILASQRKMLINRGEDPDKISDEEMGYHFEQHLSQVMDWLQKQPNFSTLFVDYNILMNDPGLQIRAVCQFLGGNLDEEKMIAAIDPQLYRQRKYGT
jgi:hypothetical protein